MKYRNTGEYVIIAESTSFEIFDAEKHDVTSFDCGQEDYNSFLINDAEYYIENNISSINLLIDNESKDIIGYLALLTDAFLLDGAEKETAGLDIPFSSVPALKIGKLAVSSKYKGRMIEGCKLHYGSFLLELSLGKATQLELSGIACRFLTVDADIEFNPDTPSFYERNGFVRNEHRSVKNRKKNVSMRYDLFTDTFEEDGLHT
ncbi:N-acetyltransferase [Bacillus cereus]|nr:N-acetyltransferase [Bacillus cereus]